jgi:hypothetical protein
MSRSLSESSNQSTQVPPAFTTDEMMIAMRGAFYNGAQYLYNEHFTTVHPFPAREVMNAATKRYTPKELRTVTILGTKYRVKDGVIEVLCGARDNQDWQRATAITPGYVKTLADLIDNPYESVCEDAGR